MSVECGLWWAEHPSGGIEGACTIEPTHVGVYGEPTESMNSGVMLADSVGRSSDDSNVALGVPLSLVPGASVFGELATAVENAVEIPCVVRNSLFLAKTTG